MISRQKLIEELERIKHDFCYEDCLRPDHVCHREDDCTICAVERVKEFIESQPPADQWIPCSERLPKKAHSYVVTEQTKDGRYIMSTRIFRGGKWVIEELYDDVKVIAWMPAEPYKGDKHEHD